MWQRIGVVVLTLMVMGCESTHDQLIDQGYPPAFADGFQAGCSSGRQAAGAMTGEYQKNVPRYIADKQYGTGWDDGFRQCNAMQQSQEQDAYRNRWDDRERAWEQQKAQGAGRAYRHP
jgi:hypothetical protein